MHGGINILNDNKKNLPEINDEDVFWATKLMGLPTDAFDGERKEVLKNLSTIDIQACPGSGKTTLLVAKLAILAKKWEDNKCGICVLSHTNVARKEIKNKLGNTDFGKQLLSYPHFVGTIHSFLNEFIALPWIRSKGFPISIIDTEVATKFRWRKLGRKIQSGLEKAKRDPKKLLTASDILGNPRSIPWGNGELGSTSNTYKAIQNSIVESFEKGIFTYDEIFVFAMDALNNIPTLKDNIQSRFLICFIDETQDCTEEQSNILSQIFPLSEKSIIKQRFGDGNQAIFHNYNVKDDVESEPFPQKEHLTISDSLRFNQKIADLSDSLGLIPYNMRGKGGQLENEPNNTIILFENEFIQGVLPIFGKIILDNYSQDMIQSLKNQNIYAVGMVHKNSKEFEKYTVASYWSDYQQYKNKTDHNPDFMIDYLKLSINLVNETNEFHYGLNLFSKGLIRYINENNETKMINNIRNPYRFISNDLSLKNKENKDYLEWLYNLFKLEDLNEDKWNKDIKPELLKLVQTITKSDLPRNISFFNWNDSSDSISSNERNISTSNHFIFNEENNQIKIKLGSIHSIKGQTHFATLVLDTFWNGRNNKTNMIYLIDWLTGDNKGIPDSQKNQNNRLKCHYVAMTRPTDILCLALPINFVTPNMRVKLENNGWNIKIVGKDKHEKQTSLNNWFS
ncbi:MAG: UvrD-helicase domain-containing protein [Methanogenium sp.]|nr:UvrD-helicase domain-containing protein [Methanogenium sp.]